MALRAHRTVLQTALAWNVAPALRIPARGIFFTKPFAVRWQPQRLHGLARQHPHQDTARKLLWHRQMHGSSNALEPKKSMWAKVKEFIEHYYTGFKLFIVDIRVSGKLLKQVADGELLTRRQRRQLIRTTGDVFRLVPMLVFIIVPFLELLLPLALKLFPNMLPSTFEHKDQREEKKLALLKMKIEMAKFLQETVEVMAKADKRSKGDDNTPTLAEFADLLQRIRGGGGEVTTLDIVRFSKVFEDTLTLDNLSKPQLAALCRMLGMNTIGTSQILRFQLRIKLRHLRADDTLIMQEGVDSLTVAELQAACQERGMRSVGVTLQRLRNQLEQWLELNKEGVPASMILLSRALYNMPEADTKAISKTLSSLSDKLVSEAELILLEREGVSVNKKKLEVIAEEEKLIEEEMREEQEAEEAQRAKEAARAAAEVLEPMAAGTEGMDARAKEKTEKEKAAEEEQEVISREEVVALAEAVNIITADSVVTPAQEDLEELQEERAEFIEETEDVQASAATRHLGSRIEKMIKSLEGDLAKVEDRLEREAEIGPATDDRKTVMTLEEIIAVAKGALKEEDAELMEKVARVLDYDKDGLIDVEEVRHVFAYLEDEGSDIKMADISRVLELVHAEEEVEELVAESEAECERLHGEEDKDDSKDNDKQVAGESR